jgi:hypothetical protein
MILPFGSATEDLLKYREGAIEEGYGVNIPELDRYIRFKKGEFNIILGHDNVGKTGWFLWYALCLSSWHGIRWTMWLGENKPWQALRNLIQMYAQKPFKEIPEQEMLSLQRTIEGWFSFVDNSKLYKPSEMLEVFKASNTEGYFIDPFTGLDREFSHEGNYKFLNDTRQFVNSTKKTIYMSSHPNTESGRAGMIYPKDHEWSGHLMPPFKDHIEGGKPFSNRVDNVIILHRLISAESDMKFKTMVISAKVKDTETGGGITPKDIPVLCDWNSGLGFKVGYMEGINREIKSAIRPPEDDGLPF